MSDRDYLYAFMKLSQEEKESLMISEAERRRTFAAHWPIWNLINGYDCAKEGFYYTGEAVWPDSCVLTWFACTGSLTWFVCTGSLTWFVRTGSLMWFVCTGSLKLLLHSHNSSVGQTYGFVKTGDRNAVRNAVGPWIRFYIVNVSPNFNAISVLLLDSAATDWPIIY